MTPEQIKELRDKLRMTGQEFGEALGYAPDFARNRTSELENGRVDPSPHIRLILAYIARYGPLNVGAKNASKKRGKHGKD